MKVSKYSFCFRLFITVVENNNQKYFAIVYRCETQTLTIGYKFSAGLSKLNINKNIGLNCIAKFLTKMIVSYEIIWEND